MQVFKGFQDVKRSFPNPVVTIGNFDGLHLGHQKIIEIVKEKAQALNGTSVVYTFRPHPHRALAPNENLALINTYEEKLELLEKFGVDIVIEEPFRRDFSNIPPESFFRDVLIKRFSVHSIYVGYDFGFGKDRSGNLDMLTRLCAVEGVELEVAKPLKVDGEVCSSSRIRQHLLVGQIPEANKLLGRPFFYRGLVMRGFERGRLLGFPTANVHLESKLQIKTGVYATWTVHQGQIYSSVTNVGLRPTFNSGASTIGQVVPVTVETYIFDFQKDIYGDEIEVQLISRIRDEKKFSSLDELKQQIALDVTTAKKILTANHS